MSSALKLYGSRGLEVRVCGVESFGILLFRVNISAAHLHGVSHLQPSTGLHCLGVGQERYVMRPRIKTSHNKRYSTAGHTCDSNGVL